MRRTGTSLLILALIVTLATGCNTDHPAEPETGPRARPAFNGGWVGGGGRIVDDSVNTSDAVLSADTATVLTADKGGWVGGGG